MNIEQRALTPDQVAKILGCNDRLILTHIKSGRLKAFDISNGSQRPRYRILLEDVNAFRLSNQVGAKR